MSYPSAQLHVVLLSRQPKSRAQLQGGNFAEATSLTGAGPPCPSPPPGQPASALAADDPVRRRTTIVPQVCFAQGSRGAEAIQHHAWRPHGPTPRVWTRPGYLYPAYLYRCFLYCTRNPPARGKFFSPSSARGKVCRYAAGRPAPGRAKAPTSAFARLADGWGQLLVVGQLMVGGSTRTGLSCTCTSAPHQAKCEAA